MHRNCSKINKKYVSFSDVNTSKLDTYTHIMILCIVIMWRDIFLFCHIFGYLSCLETMAVSFAVLSSNTSHLTSASGHFSLQILPFFSPYKMYKYFADIRTIYMDSYIQSSILPYRYYLFTAGERNVPFYTTWLP